MTYGAETWALTKQAHNKLAPAQTKMERNMLSITNKHKKTNICARERAKVIDMIIIIIIIIIKSLFQAMPIKVRCTIAQKSAQIVGARVHVCIITKLLRTHSDVAKKVYICKYKQLNHDIINTVKKTTRETSQAVERRPGQILERHDMAEDSTRQGNLETAC